MALTRKFLLAIAVVTTAGVAYGATHAPPAGWEVTPASSASAKPTSPACCTTTNDATCCERQRAVDGQSPTTVSDTVDVPVESIPLATIRKAEPGQPGIEGAPSLHYLDGQGKPPPWPEGPKGEVRVMPPQEVGELKLHDEFYMPYFQKIEFRGMGYGIVLSVDDKGKSNIAGTYGFTVIGPGTNGKLAYDHVEGKVDNAMKEDVRLWVHADMIPVARKTLFAFRQAGADGEQLHVVGPEAFRDFEARGVEVDGAHFRSRFSQAWSYSDYIFPLKPDIGTSAFFEISDFQVRRWRALGVNPDKDWASEVLVDVNGSVGGPFTLRIRFPNG